MNMKKTLAGLMAGIVAISAMATVAVSAKAQKAEEVTWSTMNKENKGAETMVYVVIPADKWLKTNTITLSWVTPNQVAGADQTLEIDSITKITLRQNGNTSVVDEDLDRFYDKDDNNKNKITLAAGNIDTAAEIELAIKVKSNGDIKKNNVKAEYKVAAGTDGDPATLEATNVKKDASDKKVGVLLNHTEDWVECKAEGHGVIGDAEAERKDTVYVYSLDEAISGHMGKELEPAAEIADVLKDAKGATIAFNFEKKDIDESVSDKEFAEWVDRYDWNADAMKSAISLRINNSNVLSVDMMEFDKANFSAVYSWDEVMSKFQVGSVTGLVRTMGLKINNDKLPSQKDDADKVIDLRLASITVKIPEMADTKDDSMVEDFAAGESATVVEDTLPATTDAPAATDATTAATDGAANPETGNSAIALLAIPAALAAAAIVAKKRG